MQRKINLMTEFIQVFQVVDPGLTKWRGKMMFQLHKTKMFLSDLKHSKDLLDSEAFKNGKHFPQILLIDKVGHDMTDLVIFVICPLIT